MRKFSKFLVILFTTAILMSMMAISTFAADREDYEAVTDDEGNATVSAEDRLYYFAIKEGGLDLCVARNETAGPDTQKAVSGADYANAKSEDFPQRYTIVIDNQARDIYLAKKYEKSCKNITPNVVMTPDGSVTLGPKEANPESVWTNLFGSIQGIIAGLTGILTLAFTVLFMIQIFKLGSSAGNPTQRQQALTGLLWTGIAAAAFGATTVIMSFFINAI